MASAQARSAALRPGALRPAVAGTRVRARAAAARTSAMTPKATSATRIGRKNEIGTVATSIQLNAGSGVRWPATTTPMVVRHATTTQPTRTHATGTAMGSTRAAGRVASPDAIQAVA